MEINHFNTILQLLPPVKPPGHVVLLVLLSIHSCLVQLHPLILCPCMKDFISVFPGTVTKKMC